MTQEYVNTVTGPIRVEDLGVTLMHEHILIRYLGWEADTLRPGPGRAEMVDTAVDKIRSMQFIGIQSMLDPCPNDLGRDVGLAAEVADKIKAVQEFGLQNGVKRVAEIVESDLVALQLNRVARESGTDKILRRFWEDDSAFDWLVHGDRERVAS